MVEHARVPDELPVFDCGAWTIDKLFFLCNYLAQFSHAMSGHSKFDGVVYLDLFCGSGICRIREGTRVVRYPGSALLAAGCEKPFDRMLFVDENRENIAALKTRLNRITPAAKSHYWSSDANALVEELRGFIPQRSLSLAFIDPYSLQIDFQTIAALVDGRQMDLIILFADRMDIGRNVEAYYYPNPKSKLDSFLGPESGWRSDWDQLSHRDGQHVRDLFADIYLRQLESLGYYHTRRNLITGQPDALFRLIFASKSETGAKFWDIASNYFREGDKGLFGI